MNFFQRRKILKKANSLELVPVRQHDHEISEDGLVTLLVPKFKNPKLANFMIPKRKPKHFSIKLDKLGSAGWLEIDGKKSIREICAILTTTLGDEIQPVEDRFTKFCFLLYEQRYITFTVLT